MKSAFLFGSAVRLVLGNFTLVEYTVITVGIEVRLYGRISLCFRKNVYILLASKCAQFCVVLCAITLPEHPSPRLSPAVIRCPIPSAQMQGITGVWRHLRPLASLAVIIVSVTAEVASSSLVVPAIHSKRVERISMKPTRVQKGAFLHPFCTPFRQLEPFSGGRPSGFDSVYASALGVVSEANTRASTAA
jgi:hypothetical protein